MQTFRKYEKIYRIEMPDYPIKGKYHLAKRVEAKLFKGIVSITEKVDGANTGILKRFLNLHTRLIFDFVFITIEFLVKSLK